MLSPCFVSVLTSFTKTHESVTMKTEFAKPNPTQVYEFLYWYTTGFGLCK